jgi:hypothetical protein
MSENQIEVKLKIILSEMKELKGGACIKFGTGCTPFADRKWELDKKGESESRNSTIDFCLR